MLSLLAFVLLQFASTHAATAPAPAPGTVAGIVVDTSGDGIAGAQVVVRPSGGGDVRASVRSITSTIA